CHKQKRRGADAASCWNRMLLPLLLLRATRPPTHTALVAGKPKIKVKVSGLVVHVEGMVARSWGKVKGNGDWRLEIGDWLLPQMSRRGVPRRGGRGWIRMGVGVI